MSLNIKNERVHSLVRRAAQLSGCSQTSVVELAMERYLAEIDRTDTGPDARHRVDVILADVDCRLSGATLTADDLYDEAGLPA